MFDHNPPPDVRDTFVDLSKALNNVWYKGLIFKLEIYSINGKLLNLMVDYLRSRQQQDVLNGQTSSQEKVLPSVLQGSV